MSCAGELVPICRVADGIGLNSICVGAAFGFAGIAGSDGGLRLLLGLLPEAAWLLRWLPWAASRRPWTCTRSRRVGSKGVNS